MKDRKKLRISGCFFKDVDAVKAAKIVKVVKVVRL